MLIVACDFLHLSHLNLMENQHEDNFKIYYFVNYSRMTPIAKTNLTILKFIILLIILGPNYTKDNELIHLYILYIQEPP